MLDCRLYTLNIFDKRIKVGFLKQLKQGLYQNKAMVLYDRGTLLLHGRRGSQGGTG